MVDFIFRHFKTIFDLGEAHLAWSLESFMKTVWPK